MGQSSKDDTLPDVRPAPGPDRGAVSRQSSRDKRRKRSLPGSTVRKEGRANSGALMQAVASRGDRRGAVLSVVLLPFEIAFWFPFALPVPPLLALIRLPLTAHAWRHPCLGTTVKDPGQGHGNCIPACARVGTVSRSVLPSQPIAEDCVAARGEVLVADADVG